MAVPGSRLSPATSSGVSRVCGWLDGWWLSCGCVSKRFTIKPQLSQLKEENAEIINCEEEPIDKHISSNLTEHVRGVALFLGMPGEGFPRAKSEYQFSLLGEGGTLLRP